MAARGRCKAPALGRSPDSLGKFHPSPQARPLGHSSGRRGASAVLVFLVELLAADLLIGHLRKLDQEVDHLFLKQRRAHARQRLWILAVIVPDLLLTPRNLAGALHDRPRQLVINDLDVVLLTDFRKHKAKPHPPLGNAAIFFPRLLLGRALVSEGAPLLLEIVFNGVPD